MRNRRILRPAYAAIGFISLALALPCVARVASAAFDGATSGSELDNSGEVEEEKTRALGERVAAAEGRNINWVQDESSKKEADQKEAGPGPLYRFHVQVAAVADRAAAMALAKRLAVTYRYTTVVDPIEKVGRKLYRVRLRVETRAQAEALAERLRKEEGFKPWIVKAD